jgi:hypothetical protein
MGTAMVVFHDPQITANWPGISQLGDFLGFLQLLNPPQADESGMAAFAFPGSEAE